MVHEDAPHTDTQGATGLQEASDDVEVGTEEIEIEGIPPLSRSDDDQYCRSSVAARSHSGMAGGEKVDSDSERSSFNLITSTCNYHPILLSVLKL